MSYRFLFAFDRYFGVGLIFVFSLLARVLGLILRRDHSDQVQGDILVIKMLGGGSLVIAFPALLGIRRAYPNAKMRLFTTSSVKPFAETLGIFDEIIATGDSVAGLGTGALHCLIKCFGHDTVIDLEVYSYLSTVLSLLTCARNRVGFFFEELGFRERLHTHRIFFHPGSPLYRHYDRVADVVGASIVSTKECADHVRKTLGIDKVASNTKPRVAVGCGCSGLSNERKLTPEQWAKNVFDVSDNKNRDVVFLGAMNDRQDAENVMNAVTNLGAARWGGKFENLCGSLPLVESLRTLASCEEFWGIESSLLHYARLLGLRCKAFFGPTHPMRLRPIEGLQEQVFYRKTICSPCIHLVSVPPCHGNNLCMQWLFENPEKHDHRDGWTPVNTGS